jgi:hypothetical protein
MPEAIEMTGRVFGAWTVIERAPRPEGFRSDQGAYWLCQCACGNKEIHNGCRLRVSRVNRGCLQCAGRMHGKRGRECSPTYNSWRGMRERCLRPDHVAYRNYGGKGITICDRWRNSFPNFLADMGLRPKGKSLDRIDSNGPYSPENCRWADAKTQARNTSFFRLTDDQVEAIRRAKADGARSIDLATISGVDQNYILMIVAETARKDAA